MTNDKLLQVLSIYRKKFDAMGIPQRNFSRELKLSASLKELEALAHCHKAIDEIEVFVKEGRIEKAFRWLGFLQGCLWMCRLYTIEELKNHNRP